jgi:hypothetical protein
MRRAPHRGSLRALSVVHALHALEHLPVKSDWRHSLKNHGPFGQPSIHSTFSFWSFLTDCFKIRNLVNMFFFASSACSR